MSYVTPQDILDGITQTYMLPARVATTGSLNILFSVTVIDGVNLSDGDRVLVKDQTSGAENGVYVWASGTQLLTRAKDALALISGAQIKVQEGAAGGATTWHLSTVGAILVGTTALVFLPSRVTPIVEVTKTWSFQTDSTGLDYAGGFYDFAPSDDDFSAPVNFGSVNAAIAAHILFVTGALTVNEVTIEITGTSITDNGVRTPADTEEIVIPNATGVGSYFESSKKWNGQVSVSTTNGTAITCNYGYVKYSDLSSKDFTITGLEALWSSDATDSTSNIELLHHTATGWTFNSGSVPTPPPPIAARATDYGAENDQRIGQGAWKRAGFSQAVDGSINEGVLWRITSGTAGVGTSSFRALSLELTLETT